MSIEWLFTKKTYRPSIIKYSHYIHVCMLNESLSCLQKTEFGTQFALAWWGSQRSGDDILISIINWLIFLVMMKFLSRFLKKQALSFN
jgi:hypothetical protein